MGNLRDHAKYELELIGEEPETIEWYLKVVDAFSSFGHSGGSASVTIPVLYKLLNYENLKPLTSDPDEWIDHGSISGAPLWQNKRNSRYFSTDGGKSWYKVEDKQ